MNTSDLLEREPAEIEAEIARTRESLDRKLHEIERRLDPRRQWAQVRSRLETPVATLGAVVAIAVGTWMAVSGLRRYYGTHERDMFEDMRGPDAMVAHEVVICE